jgi:hypothetical protein
MYRFSVSLLKQKTLFLTLYSYGSPEKSYWAVRNIFYFCINRGNAAVVGSFHLLESLRHCFVWPIRSDFFCADMMISWDLGILSLEIVYFLFCYFLFFRIFSHFFIFLRIFFLSRQPPAVYIGIHSVSVADGIIRTNGTKEIVSLRSKELSKFPSASRRPPNSSADKQNWLLPTQHQQQLMEILHEDSVIIQPRLIESLESGHFQKGKNGC